MAALNPQLAQDTVELGRFPLCRVLLMRDANYPWTVLVPDRDGVSEIFQLPEADQQQLLKESSALAQVLNIEFNADKLNIAALGNVVPQLHVHHVVRYQNDPAWPAPVWGKVPAVPYSDAELEQQVEKITAALLAIADIEFTCA
jgi:diadenosine tetraphosphate (Ap4A) HIT family hydrolase